MGKAHSNAFSSVSSIFDLPVTPVMHTACGRDEGHLSKFSKQFGWKHAETSWEKMVSSDGIDLVDICAPNNLHKAVAIKAMGAGKNVLCEKPISRNEEEAYEMCVSAKKSGAINMVVFNYRYLPAIVLAKQFIVEGKIGEVRHFNAVYYQDWLTDKDFPMVWRHDVKVSGSGAHGDMNAHTVDLARYLVGEIDEVNGVKKIFIKERPNGNGKELETVTADDATSFLAQFQNGALGAFMATRVAPGRKNFLRLEIFGSEGSLIFNLERLNELQFYSCNGEAGAEGYKNILVTDPTHPYMKAWWPPGHTIGWEHTFIHVVKELLETIAGLPRYIPTFFDGYKCQQVLDAVIASSHSRSWIRINNLQKLEDI